MSMCMHADNCRTSLDRLQRLGTAPPPAISERTPELSFAQTCTQNQQSGVGASPPCKQATSQAKVNVNCAGNPSDTTAHQEPDVSLSTNCNSVYQQHVHPTGSDDYSYPNLRVNCFGGQGRDQCTDDGYIIIHPDTNRKASQEKANTIRSTKYLGSKTIMDHTL